MLCIVQASTIFEFVVQPQPEGLHMPDLMCSDWDEEVGACIKHGVPQTPCPACLAEKNPNVQVLITERDRMMADWDPEFTVEGMFSEDHQWLAGRIINL